MNTLTEFHLDALAEIFNVGAGRAALSLSEIVGDEVHLTVPSVEIIKSDKVCLTSLALNNGRFGAVSQHFNGPFSAEATLLITEDHALEIVRDMMGSQVSAEQLAEFEHEAMCELGNIILNACLSAMADMLNITLEGSLPDYEVASSDELLQRFGKNADQSYMLILHIDLVIQKRCAEGKLVFLLSSGSLNNLAEQIKQFIGNLE